MKFETHLLENPLKDFVESIFYFKGFNPNHSIERVVPTGHVFVIFELDEMERSTFDNETLKPNGVFNNVWVSGNHNNYLSISAHQDSEMLVIQFKTSGSYPFFNVPMHQLNNKVIDAQELFGPEILELRKKILNQEAVTDKFKIIETWLLNRFNAGKTPSDELVTILEQLRTKPVVNHSDIITLYPRTQKHLIDQFKKYFGLTPKVFHRIFRFNEILQQIQAKERIVWSQIAYQFGYSDQSHFIKEFKEFSGFNPQEFINSDYHKDETNFFPLDREG